jgi:PKD repeat protein
VLVATPAKGQAPLDVTFTLEGNHATNLLPRYFSFGDNQRFFQTNPEFPLEHSYKKAGTYTAALRMENGDNDYITCSAKISVDASKVKDDQKTDRKQVEPNSSRIIEKTPEPVEEESTEKESEEKEPAITEPEPEAEKTSPRFVRVE